MFRQRSKMGKIGVHHRRQSVTPHRQVNGKTDPYPPKGREPFRRLDVMGVVRLAFDQMPVEIHRGRRAKRAQFRRLGGQGGGKERRHQQANHSMRQMGQNEGDENVIAVVLLRVGIGVVQQELRVLGQQWSGIDS